MPHVNIILPQNRNGLKRDAKILSDVLEAGRNRVTITAISQPDSTVAKAVARTLQTVGPTLYTWANRKPHYDINLFLEHAWPRWLGTAGRNCLIPNPEWLRSSCESQLEKLDLVLCKTVHAKEVFDRLGAPTEFIGFTSLDRARCPRTGGRGDCLHMACRNSQKGTEVLARVWREHPSWPSLQIVNVPPRYLPLERDNIEHCGQLTEEDLLRRQNGCDIHLCPSEVEGWGHSIVESMSARAVVLTTNAPPMNELVTADRGVLVDYQRIEPMRRGIRYFPDPNDLAQKIEEILAMDGDKRLCLGEKARSWYEANHTLFMKRLNAVIQNL